MKIVAIALLAAVACSRPAWSEDPQVDAAVPVVGEPAAAAAAPAEPPTAPAAAVALDEPTPPPAPVTVEPAAEPSAPAPAPEPGGTDVMPGTIAVGNGSVTGYQDRITISLNDVPLTQVVELFTRLSGANIISTPTNLTGHVTVSLKDVEWKAALDAILDQQGLMLQRKSPDQEMYSIVARPAGTAEPTFIRSFVLKFRRPEQVAEGVKLLLAPNGQVLHASGNMLSVLGTSKQLDDVAKLIEEIDQRVSQVVVEAKFVELNEQAIKDLGINWQVLQGYRLSANNLIWNATESKLITDQNVRQNTTFDRRTTAETWTKDNTRSRTGEDMTQRFYDINGVPYQQQEVTAIEFPPDSGIYTAVTNLTPTRSLLGGLSSAIGSGYTLDDGRAVGYDRSHSVLRQDDRSYSDVRSAVLSADEFALTLSALKQNEGADVVSNPKVIVASGDSAAIHVGRKDPEIRAVADDNLGGRLTYERQDWIETGVKLNVRPIVNTESIISVVITTQLSRVIGYVESGDVVVKNPILSSREISSQFNLPSGQTVAIGGLTETTDHEVVKKVPFLGDIPIIGKYFFTHTHTEKKQDEVVIFVTLALADPENILPGFGLPSQSELVDKRFGQGPSGKLQLRKRDERPGDTNAPPKIDWFAPVKP
jgi:type II secretory pathway component GspD/PulD (secretin)